MGNGYDTDDNRFLVSLTTYFLLLFLWFSCDVKDTNIVYVNNDRQTFTLISARMFDYFDNGVMEELQHRLLHTVTITNGVSEAITFKGRSIGRRVTATGSVELLIKWTPNDMYDKFYPKFLSISATQTKAYAKFSITILQNIR